MDLTVVKFVLLWTVCEIIGLTRSIPLGDINPNIRPKRSPADNFSLFGLSTFSVSNPITKARESISTFRNIFAPAVSQYERVDRTHQSSIHMQPTNYEPINPIVPIDNSFRNGVPNLMIQHAGLEKVNKNTVRQETKNKVDESENQSHDLYTKLETNAGTSENETDQNSVSSIDKNLLDYIFQTKPDNSIDGTTVDTTIDFTTETGDYESTTTDELLRIPAPVVASLLG